MAGMEAMAQLLVRVPLMVLPLGVVVVIHASEYPVLSSWPVY